MSKEEVLDILMMHTPDEAAGAAGQSRTWESKRLRRARKRATRYAMAGIGPLRHATTDYGSRDYEIRYWIAAVITRRNRLMQREYGRA
jgi:hypothetical protein